MTHLVVLEKGLVEPPDEKARARYGSTVVGSLSHEREQIPGGNEALQDGIADGDKGRRVLPPIVLSQVVDTDMTLPDLLDVVKEAATTLRTLFQEAGSQALAKSTFPGPRVLVTVVRFPIHVCPKGMNLPAQVLRNRLTTQPEWFQGFEVRCEYFQVVRRAPVDPGVFQVRSWEGGMPITLPARVHEAVDIHRLIRDSKLAMVGSS